LVSGSDVYVAGYERNDNGKDVAQYWKNGTLVKLTDSIHTTNAYSIFVVTQ